MVDVQIAPELECLRCHFKWRPKKAEIVACPKCRSPYWNRPKTVFKKEKKA